MKFKPVIVVIFCGLLCSCTSPVSKPYLKKEIAAYRGDGEMKDISLRFLWCRIKGYQISFPQFPLNNPTNAEYALLNLPPLPYCGLYLRVNGPKEKTNLGQWHLTLLGSTGDTLREVSLKTDQMIWASQPPNDFSLYDRDKSFFDPQDKQAYKVRIKFTPSSSNDLGTGALFIRCGGQI